MEEGEFLQLISASDSVETVSCSDENGPALWGSAAAGEVLLSCKQFRPDDCRGGIHRHSRQDGPVFSSGVRMAGRGEHRLEFPGSVCQGEQL